MTRQSSLAETLELLRKDGRESSATWQTSSAGAVLETGGVSVDRFVERLTEDRARAFARWDGRRPRTREEQGEREALEDGGKVHAAGGRWRTSARHG